MTSPKPSFGSAIPLIALQLGSRVFSFALNQALLRIATPSAFGTATIQFELLLNTILFLSREGVRTALLRANTPSSRVDNVAFVPFFLGCPIALLGSYLYVAYSGEETSVQPYFREAVYLYVAGALIELLKEPMHNAIMAGLQTKIRLRAEGVAVVGKSMVTFLVMYTDPYKDDPQKHRALVAFALGQVFYSVCVQVIYLYHFGTAYLFPRKSTPFFNPQLLRLSATVTSQSLVKHFLTEGDKFILSWFSPLEDQGGYAVALNYGSLIARIILQPLEETSRSIFSQLVASNDLHAASSRLQSLISIQIPLSLFLPVFGPPFIPLVAQILLPPRYLATSTPQVLSAWLWYIPILALNGQLEAFMASAADTADLNKQSAWMGAFSAMYTASAVLAYRMELGDASLVYANVLNLGARIVYTMSWTTRYFEKKGTKSVFGWNGLLPAWSSIVGFVVSGALVRYSGDLLGVEDTIARTGRSAILQKPVLVHVALGGALGLLMLWHTIRALRRDGRMVKQKSA